jgi:protein-S-isoprenylcysteine O-methyltransferase Ste14
MKNHPRMTRKQTQHREDLAGEHVFGDLGQLILFVLFITTWILDSFVFRYTIFFSTIIPHFVRIPLSIVIFYCSGYLARSGLRIVFGEVREEPAVIRDGVFGILRHPIYLGAILFYLGFLVLSFSLTACMLWLIAIGFYHFLAKFEEKKLIMKFGLEYQMYIEEVPMWIPYLKIRHVK